MSGMMISRMGKIAALSAVKRSNGEQKYNQKRALRKEVDNQMLQRRRARVQAARSTLGSPESEAQRLLRHAHQYGEAVSKMNRSRIGKPNRMKRINRHPNPEPKRKQEKSLVTYEDERKSNNNSRSSGGKNEPTKATESGDSTKGGWGDMYRYQAIKLEKEAQEEKLRKLKARKEMKAYLDDQVKRKEAYFVNKEKDKAYWLKKNNDDAKTWKTTLKQEKRSLLGKNLEIKKAREIQLKELHDRRMKEQIILKEEDDRMLARQKREKIRAARAKQQKIKEQELALMRVKVENERVLKEKQKLKEDKWAEEARLDAEWKEILDKQERARGERLAEIKKKQQGLETIGLQAQQSMAEQLAADEARAKRHQLELQRKEDEKAAAVIAKKEKMKNDMMKSIDEAIKLKEQLRQKRAIVDAKFAAKLKRLNNIELDKLDHADDGREA
jgi:hypothetical protein